MNRFACGREIRVKNRREFLAQSAFGFGALALGHLLDRDGGVARSGRCPQDVIRQPFGSSDTALPRQGKVGDFYLPARRSKPSGQLRPEAGPRAFRWPPASPIASGPTI